MERNNSYKSGVLGGHGEDFQRNLALVLLTRATLGRRPFKLGIEMRDDAGKFDDVVLFDERSEEWWLIQTKHSLQQNTKLTAEALLPRVGSSVNGDFSIYKYFRSYLHVRQHWPHGGRRIRFFLFTNKEFDGSLDVEEAEVDETLRFPNAKHSLLRPTPEVLQALQDHVNSDYDVMCEAIVRLFSGNGVDQMLKKYKLPLSQVLIKCDETIRFAEDFNPSNSNWRLRKLYGTLTAAFEKVGIADIASSSVALPKEMADFWTVKSRDKETVLPIVDRGTVERFFEHFVLSSSQPNARELVSVINDEWRFWMRDWIRPDVLGKLSKDQLTIPFHSFRIAFEQWEKRSQSQEVSSFLLLEDGEQFLQIVESKMNSLLHQVSNQARLAFDASESLYVNRRISYAVKDDSLDSNSDRDSKQYYQISDSEFVERLYNQFNDQRCMVLTAEPGMGKTTLWQHLAFRVQQQYPDTFVFLLYLNDFTAKLPAISNLDEALSIIPISLSRKNTQLVKTGEQNVILFMDAFDEVDSYNMPQVFQLINILKACKNIKILISSRGRIRDEIEQQLGVESMLLVPLDDRDQNNFLKRYWDVREGPETSKFNEFVGKLQQKFRSVLLGNDCDFMGLPITMKMIAEIYSDPFQQYLRSEAGTLLSDEKLINVDLYEQFTTKCIVMQYKKKNKLHGDESKIIKTFIKQIEADKYRYQLLAMKVLTDDVTLTGITDDKFATQLDSFMAEILQGHEESLLIETIDGAARFSHLSYAEFFAAKYLYTRIAKAVWKTIPQISVKFLFSSTTLNSPFSQSVFNVLEAHKPTRAFFLAMVNAQTHQNHLHLLDQIDHRAAFWACESNCHNLLQHLQNLHNFEKIRSTDDNSMIHVAVESNALEALQYLLESAVGVDPRNANLDTPLMCACRLGYLDAVKLLLAKGADVNLSGQLHRTPLYQAVFAGHTEIVRYLLENSTPNVNCRTIALRESPLHRAAVHGNLVIVQLLINAGAEVNSVDTLRNTPLLNAARRGHADVVRHLVNHSANHDSRDKAGWSALHHAARYGFPDVVTILLAVEQADVDPEEYSGATPLHIAVSFGHAIVAQQLIDKSAEIYSRNRRGLTPLHCAAEKGFQNLIDLLITRGAIVNSSDAIGRTPLHCAVQGGHTEVVRHLIELSSEGSSFELSNTLEHNRKSLFGCRLRSKTRQPSAWYFVNQSAEINCRDRDGCTPLHYAAERGFKAIVELLLSAGADTQAVDYRGKTALNYAIRCGHDDIVHCLKNSTVHRNRNSGKFLHYAAGEREIKQFLSVNGMEGTSSSADPNQKSALHYAAALGHSKTVRHLLTEETADPTARDNAGMTPLHSASREGFTVTVQQLIAANANVNATANDSTTALHLAAKFGRTEVVQSLLEHSASINCRDEDGWTPLHYAADKGFAKTVQLLIDTGADANLPEELGCTPLHRAVYSGRTEAVRCLIAHTRDLNRKDVWGQTPLHYAAWKGLREIVELLVDCGADVRVLSDQQLTALDYADGSSDVREYLLAKERRSSKEDDRASKLSTGSE